MQKKYDLAVKVGEYKDNNNDKKAKYKNIGCIMTDDKNNYFILLDKFINYAAIAANSNSDNILVSMFAVKNNNSNNRGYGNNNNKYSQDDPNYVPF